MKFVLHKESNTPIYQQIYVQIVQRIQGGLMTNGEQLPSLRALADELDVSMLTVRKAYKWLETKGYVFVQAGKGVFIRGKKQTAQQLTDPYGWQHSLAVNVVRSQYLINRQKKYYDFSQAVVYPRLLPTQFLANEMQKMLEKNRMMLATYGPVQGDEELRIEMAKYLKAHQGLTVNPSNLLITSGVQQGIDLIAQTLLKPGDTVIVESPCYGAAVDVFVNKGMKLLPIELDEQGIRPDLLEDVCQKEKPVLLYVNPSFHNPTGTLMSEQRRRELLELAELYHFFIIEDDSFGDIYFDQNIPPNPLKRFDKNGHVIYLKGFSKTLAPGLRVAGMFAEGPVFDWLYAVKAFMDIGSPLITQKAVLPFLRTDRMVIHLEKLRTALQIRRDTTVEIISSLTEGVTFQIPQGGFNLWLALPDFIDPHALLEQAKEDNVSFLPGPACFVQQPENPYIRVSYSLLSDQDLQIGLQKLCKVILQAGTT
ncbi:PLP-dependent aminotransferase family protein [Peribacillus cavernae]|uniref:PLP-dependent aminotransferase family protein n=1 Tax=Peribacillus cavernae TaxID=1674310 RepID=A0A3S0V7K8_9BACI|nr:PLP-dependent aminotransferase family protein [Peribacillus cavernae]MDQ0219736.1 DNA-binding transcriptional MocR family regulator [Peribacillus cavernae]RUQ25157.1 PLP-dependent aminotransferase family protein [Peribacillus cavernae]